MKRIVIIIFISILISHNCQKDNNGSQKDRVYILKIIKNSQFYSEYKYTDYQMIHFKDFSNLEFKGWLFEYNSLNELIEVNEFNNNSEQVLRYEFAYSSDSLISSIFVYKFKNGDESFLEEKELIYDEYYRLIKIKAYLPETFEYNGLDIIKHGKVSNKGIWIDYEYTYDNNINVLSKIGMPSITAMYISKHNINSVTANWIEEIDNEGIDSIESTIKHKDLIYTSIFEYNESRYPKREYRQYVDHIDTLEYVYE